MNKNNFELFSITALYVLVKSFEEFPKFVHVNKESVAFDAVKANEKETYDEAWNLAEIGEHTVNWLAEEGFIKVDMGVDESEFIVQLKLKGLTLLGFHPPTAKENEFKNIAEEASSVLIGGTKSAIEDVVKGLVTSAFAMAPVLFT